MVSSRHLTLSCLILLVWMELTPATLGQPAPQGCTVNLIADGRDTAADAGDVSVASNGDGTWTVIFTAAFPWMIESIHVHASCNVDGFPLTSKGSPMVGRFAYNTSYDPPVAQATVVVDDPGCCATGGPTLFAAHAEVLDASGCRGKRCRSESAWGDGPAFPGSSWATYIPCECHEACCLADGSCADMTASACRAAGDDPQGPGTDCASFAGCPQACCFSDGSCFDLPEGFCLPAGGTPGGPGTDCATASCTPACCEPGGTCSDSSLIACRDRNGLAQGFGSACATAECPFEACCRRISGDISCDEILAELCLSLGGESHGLGSSCATTQCTEACCFESSGGLAECDDQIPGSCESAGGVPLGPGTQCPSGAQDRQQLCVDPLGFEACCDELLSDGPICDELDPQRCLSVGGESHGPGSRCTTTQCTEACCFESSGGLAECDDRVPSFCESAGGVPLGPGTLCPSGARDQQELCVDPLGFEACCDQSVGENAFCYELDPQRCLSVDGVSHGPGSTCATTQCTEACCFESSGGFADCDDRVPNFCEAHGGIPLGPGTQCPSGFPADVCVAPLGFEACCDESDSIPFCYEFDPQRCLSVGGESHGPGSRCAATDCNQACCFADGSCESLFSTECEAQGGDPQGVGTQCGLVTCPPVIGP